MHFKVLGRKWAFQYLYQLSFSQSTSSSLEDFFQKLEDFQKFQKLAKEKSQLSKEFCFQLVEGYFKNKKNIESLIKKHSLNWSYNRVSHIEKSILAICIYEGLYLKEKLAIVLSECLKLGSKYGDKKSYTFLNGVLDKILKKENIENGIN